MGILDQAPPPRPGFPQEPNAVRIKPFPGDPHRTDTVPAEVDPKDAPQFPQHVHKAASNGELISRLVSDAAELAAAAKNGFLTAVQLAKQNEGAAIDVVKGLEQIGEKAEAAK